MQTIITTSMSTITELPDDGRLAELRLLHLADSALPIGALAHSFGMESLADAGVLTPAGVADFLHGYVEETGVMEAVFCRAAVDLRASPAFPSRRWVELNQRLSARKPSRESRAGSGALGWNFLLAVVGLGDFPALHQALAAAREAQTAVHHSLAFGLVAGLLGLEEERAVLAFLHQSLAGLISACQRLLPIGQSEATRILWKLKPALIEAVARSRSYSVEDVPCFTPLLDWAAMEHPALTTRLFIS